LIGAIPQGEFKPLRKEFKRPERLGEEETLAIYATLKMQIMRRASI